MSEVTIIGAGLAGSEAAWQAAQAGCQVTICEMRPQQMTPAHQTGLFAELVCSNSLGAYSPDNAAGLLKEEMRRMNSLIIRAAEASRLPAGGALAVDRTSFSQYIMEALSSHPGIRIVSGEVTELPAERPLVVATGPLTSAALTETIAEITGGEYLYFFDAAAPIITADSLNMDIIYRASRYGKGDADYLNCPMNKEQYEVFWQELTQAETAPIKDFERNMVFEGCMPVEVMGSRGVNTLCFGPMRPVGLRHPVTGEQPHAVVQLRQENAEATLYNMVGFQTNLKWGEQKRVFRLIPGLENAEFVRYGVMHRNTFLNAPKTLEATMEVKERPGLFFAGQITGVEGYVESAASGLLAGLNAARSAMSRPLLIMPEETAHGALFHHITHADPRHFQPMNMNWGIFPPLDRRIKDKKEKARLMGERALQQLADCLSE